MPEIGQALDLAEEGAFTDVERHYYDQYWDSVRVERSKLSEADEEGFTRDITQGREETLKFALERMINLGIHDAEARRLLGLPVLDNLRARPTFQPA